jgi:hypothetical protein
MEIIGDYLYAGVWYNGMWRAKLTDLLSGFSGTPENKPGNELILQQNSPNPFSTNTEISYTVRNPGHVSLTIIDLSGNIKASLIDAYQTAGEYTASFSPLQGTLPPGIYYYRLEADNIVQVKKMLHLP